MTRITQDKIIINVADGSTMPAYVARPETGSPHPGIIVLQEAFGVNAHIRSVTDRLAREGYVAIAPELFHRTGPGFEGNYDDFTAVLPHMQAVTAETAEADVRAAFGWLQSQRFTQPDDICSVGFCMGGRISFLANSALPLRAAVSFYGGGIPQFLDRAATLSGPMLLMWGDLDKHIPPEQRRQVIDALRQRGKTFANVEFSDADHGFFCDARASYQPQAARQAWVLMLEFLQSRREG